MISVILMSVFMSSETGGYKDLKIFLATDSKSDYKADKGAFSCGGLLRRKGVRICGAKDLTRRQAMTPFLLAGRQEKIDKPSALMSALRRAKRVANKKSSATRCARQ